MLHSDALYSAVTIAMRDCGWLDEWVEATAQSKRPAVRLSSLYPYTGSTLLVVPPGTVWPPPLGGKLRWKTARFVPLTLVPRLLAGEELSEEQWAVDPVSECLLPVFKNSVAAAPFRVTQRVLAPVDRVSASTENVDRVACLQFAQGAGLWFVAEFADEEARSVWSGRMRAVSRLLADAGIGGGRSRGWGRSREPQFGNVELPEFLTGIAATAEGETAWWVVSLFTPSEADSVVWDRGTYRVVVRSGRVENGDLKPASRMVAEGSVLVSSAPPSGTARNVAPAESAHPVYRSGIALSVRIPYQQRQRWELMEHATVQPVNEPAAPAEEIPETTDSPESLAPSEGAVDEATTLSEVESDLPRASTPVDDEIPVGIDLPQPVETAETPGMEPPPAEAAVDDAPLPADSASDQGEPATLSEDESELPRVPTPVDEIPVGIDLPQPVDTAEAPAVEPPPAEAEQMETESPEQAARPYGESADQTEQTEEGQSESRRNEEDPQ